MSPFLSLMIIAHSRVSASPVSLEICGELRVNHSDVASVIDSVDDTLDDNYFPDNSNKPARGAKVRVLDNATGVAAYTWLDDADPACSDVVLEGTHTYNLRLYAESEINGNSLSVHTAQGAHLYFQGSTAYVPVANATKWLTTGFHDAWNVLSAASWAMHRRDAGLEGEAFEFWLDDCPDIPDISCQREEILWIDSPNSKYVVAHELGHAIADAKNGWNDDDSDSSLNTGTCSSSGPGSAYEFGSREFSSTAAVEGIAWYYAAVAFNISTEGDCEIKKSADLDQNGISGEDAKNEDTPSCEGELVELWATADYMSDMCNSTAADQGTIIDWTRGFWDADNNEGLSTANIFKIWNEANPNTWDENGGGTAGNNPAERLEDAASALGFWTEWDATRDLNGLR